MAKKKAEKFAGYGKQSYYSSFFFLKWPYYSSFFFIKQPCYSSSFFLKWPYYSSSFFLKCPYYSSFFFIIIPKKFLCLSLLSYLCSTYLKREKSHVL